MNKKVITAALLWVFVVPLARSQTIETVTAAGLYEPYAVGVDLTSNTYYFTDSANNRVVRFEPSKRRSSMLAENRLGGPQGIVVTKNGIYITESILNRVTRMSPEGDLSLVAGGTRGSANGVGAVAQFNSPAGIAADADGNLYIADLKNNAVRRVTALGEVSTYATGLNEPSGVAVDDKGVVYIADTRNHVIKRVSAPGAIPELVAGRNKLQGTDDGTGGEATFNNPRALAWIGGETGLLVSDTGNHSIRRVYQKGGVWRVETIAGRSGDSGVAQGTPAEARFNGPLGLSLDAEGSILICDLYNNALRVMRRTPVETPEITPVSGSYSNSVSLVIKSATTNALFRYTLDASDPTPFSASTAGALDLTGGPVSVKLRGYSADLGTSLALSNRYTFFVATPVMNPAGGSFTNNIAVSVAQETRDSALKFTTDGTIPLLTSKDWVDSTVSSNVLLRIRGFRNGFDPSEVLSNRFEFAVSPLLISVAGGTFNNTTNIIVATATDGADLRYTLDGSEPSLQSFRWTNGLHINGPLKVKGFKNGYTAATTISNLFRFVVGDVIVNFVSLSSSNSIPITVSSVTSDTTFYYTYDGSEPSESSPSSQKLSGTGLLVDRNGLLKIKGFKSGFEPSTTWSNIISLKVASPVIDPGSTNAFNPLRISLEGATDQSKIYWTLNGSNPTEQTGTEYVPNVPFEISRSGQLKARAFRKDFAASDVSTANFELIFAPLKFQRAGGTNVNEITFEVSTATASRGAETGIYYTTDGSDPTTNSFSYTGPKALSTNALVKVVGIRDGYTSSAVISADFRVKVPRPTMSPSSGYFPNGAIVTLGLAAPRADAQIRYTLDGSEPSENSTLYQGPFSVNQVVSPGQDLRLVRARAFAPNTLPSDIISGQPVEENSLGIPRNMNAGIGSTIIVPVVLNLRTNLVLRSLQFVVDVSPDTPTTKSLGNELRGLNLTTNDFVRVAGSGAPSGPALYSTSPYRSGAASRLAVSAIGTNANFSVSDYGTVALLAVTIPPDAAIGDQYKIQILEPSGTTNALQAMPIRFIAKQLKLTSALLRGLQRHHHAGWTHSPL